MATSTQFDLTQSPSDAVAATGLKVAGRMVALANAESGTEYTVQGSQDASDPPADESWYTVGRLSGPTGRLLLGGDASLAYRVIGGAADDVALAFLTGETGTVSGQAFNLTESPSELVIATGIAEAGRMIALANATSGEVFYVEGTQDDDAPAEESWYRVGRLSGPYDRLMLDDDGSVAYRVVGGGVDSDAVAYLSGEAPEAPPVDDAWTNGGNAFGAAGSVGTTDDQAMSVVQNGAAFATCTAADATTIGKGSASARTIITNGNGGTVNIATEHPCTTTIGMADDPSTVRINHSRGVGLNCDAGTSAALQVDSTTRGFLPPRMSTAERNAISSPAEGLMVYDTTLHKYVFRAAAAWEVITSS